MKILLKEINKFYEKDFSSLREVSRDQLIFNDKFSSYLSQKYNDEEISSIMLEFKFSEFKPKVAQEKITLTLDDMPDVSAILGEPDKSNFIAKKPSPLPESLKRRITYEIKRAIRRKNLSPIKREEIIREFVPVLTASFAQTKNASSRGYKAIGYHQRVKLLKSTNEYKKLVNAVDNVPKNKILMKK